MAEQPPEKRYLATLLAKLGVDASSLPLLPAALLEEVVAGLWRDTADQAKAFVEIGSLRSGPAAEGETLRDYFRERDAREDEPWKKAARRAQVQIDASARAFGDKAALETLRSEFLSGAKAGSFCESECLVLSWLLCSPFPAERSLFELASLLVRVPRPARVEVHNWAVAGHMAAARREAHGGAIATLAAPLFFDLPAFAPLNGRLLADLGPQGGGGGSGGLFARRSLLEVPRRAPAGAGALPIRGPGGQQTAELETGPLEAELAAVRAQLAQLAGRGRGRGYGRGRGPPPHYQQPQMQPPPPPQQQQYQRQGQQNQQPPQQKN